MHSSHGNAVSPCALELDKCACFSLHSLVHRYEASELTSIILLNEDGRRLGLLSSLEDRLKSNNETAEYALNLSCSFLRRKTTHGVPAVDVGHSHSCDGLNFCRRESLLHASDRGSSVGT